MKSIAKIIVAIGVIAAILSVWITFGSFKESEWMQSVGTALLGIFLAAIVTPHSKLWLWNWSKWVMRRSSGETESEDIKSYKRDDYEASKEVQTSVSSLSHLRDVKIPELWVVSSGKGGVGKSFLSLGLAEMISIREHVLLVDFDLHNRGLTSLLDIDVSKSDCTAFALLGEFRDMLKGRNEDSPYRQLLGVVSENSGKIDKKDFKVISNKYARTVRSNKDIWEELVQFDVAKPKFSKVFPDNNLDKADNSRGLCPENLTFLYSRARGDNFLLSEQSDSSYVVVALFLQAFCTWIQTTERATVVILDCHGAHDHLMAGAIVAADKLLVVTTPDPGSYDGTKELLDFVAELKGRDVPTVIALNNCKSWDRRFEAANKAFSSYEKHLEMRGVVYLAQDQVVREITSNYKFGDIAKHKLLWTQVCEIGNMLKYSRQEIGAPEPILDKKKSAVREGGSKKNANGLDEDAPSK